jgi:hypothetical protein
MFGSKGVLAVQPFLTSLTSNCPLLTELILKDSVRGPLTLATIGKSCHHLRTLDITGSQINCHDLVHLCVQSPPNVVSDKYLVSMHSLLILTVSLLVIPPLWSSGQSVWLQIQRSRVRFPAVPDFLRSSGSGTGSTQPCEDNWGATWRKK